MPHIHFFWCLIFWKSCMQKVCRLSDIGIAPLLFVWKSKGILKLKWCPTPCLCWKSHWFLCCIMSSIMAHDVLDLFCYLRLVTWKEVWWSFIQIVSKRWIQGRINFYISSLYNLINVVFWFIVSECCSRNLVQFTHNGQIQICKFLIFSMFISCHSP